MQDTINAMNREQANALYRQMFPHRWTAKQSDSFDGRFRKAQALSHYNGFISALKVTGRLPVEE